MSPQDQNYGAGADAAHQADTIQKQMSIAEEAAKPQEEPVDNSILAGIEADEDMKSLSDVIHEGATQPDPTPTDFASEPAVPTKEKKPGSKKPLIIAIIAVVVLAAAGVGVWALLSALGGGEGSGGAKADPDRVAFFVGDEDNTKYAIFNDKGEKLSDFVYDKVSDFNDAGYAVAKKADADEVGIVTNTGKLAVAYGKYSSIEGFGQYFIAESEEGKFLINGTDEHISKADQSETKYGLYSIYNGSKSFIYDGEGVKIGESSSKKPLGDLKNGQNTVCVYGDGKMRCYDSTNGKKRFEVESKTPLVLDSFTAVSSNVQCIRFKEDSESKYNHVLYHYGKLTEIGDSHKGGSLITSTHIGSDNCFFTDSSKIVMGGDGIDIPMNNNFTTANVVVLDSKRYAYVHAGTGLDKYIVLHMGDEEVKLMNNKIDWPTIAGGKDYIVVQYDKKLAIYKDSLTPVFEVEKDNEYFSASYTGNLDENGNVASNRYLIKKDGKILYKSSNYSSHMSYKNGVYLLRGTTKDDGMYTGVINTEGKAIIEEGKFESITVSEDGKFFVGKKGKVVTLLDKSGKELLSGYDAFNTYKSYVVAIKDGKYEYYSLDMKKLN